MLLELSQAVSLEAAERLLTLTGTDLLLLKTYCLSKKRLEATIHTTTSSS